MENSKIRNGNWYETITVKMVIIGFMGLCLLIPLQLVKEVIKERSAYSDEARAEISRSWASSQVVTGPVLNVPGSMYLPEEKRTVVRTLHILPENINGKVKVTPEKRRRGIYETVVYESEVSLTGSFSTENHGVGDGYLYDWSRAYITLGVTDNKGLTGSVIMNLGGIPYEAEPGTIDGDLFGNGITFQLGGTATSPSDLNGEFSIGFGLRGSEGLFFSPVGKNTTVEMTSQWPAPSFRGNFLPSVREVTDAGFSASWLVTHLNRSFPQVWSGERYKPEEDAFGVDLIIEVDHYRKSERSAKYGILFIIITFFVLVVVEIRSAERVHLFYYLLSGFALVVFFSLLSALSEHVGFSPAYIISSAATITLLGVFFGHLLKKRSAVLVISGALTALYAFIFILLDLRDYAYLAGNIGIFILLAVLMLVSSRYRLFATPKQE